MSYKPKEIAKIEHKPNPWIVRDKQINEMVNNYIIKFRNSSLFLTTPIEKRTGLMQYATHVAKIQSQIITGAKVGFNSIILFRHGTKPDSNDVNNFMKEQRILCSNGEINIDFPLWVTQ